MPTSADLLLDTSTAIPLINPNAALHQEVTARTRGLVLGLAGHAQFETYSVLTRLPGASRLSTAAAERVISVNFPATVNPTTRQLSQALTLLRDAGIAGGAVYDGLVALAAREAGILRLSADRRAASTYNALAVAYELVQAAEPAPRAVAGMPPAPG